MTRYRAGKQRKAREEKPTVRSLPYHLGIKVVAYPSSAQKEIIRQNSDASRFFYNRLVALGNERWRKRRELALLHQITQHIGRPVMTGQAKYVNRQERTIDWLSEQIKNPTRIKEQYKWLSKNRNLDAFAFVRVSANYQRAWTRFVKVPEAGVPQFHKQSSCQRYQTSRITNRGKTDTVRVIDRTHIRLPKLETIRIQPLPDWYLAREDIKISTVTVKKDAVGRYTIGFQIASAEPFKLQPEKTGSEIGIVLNLENFLTDSNGEVVENPRYYRKSAEKLAKARRKLNQLQNRAKQDGRPLSTAKHYQRQREQVAALERKVANQRGNFLHNLSTQQIKKHDLIVAENLLSKNMMKNRRLALSICDAGWRIYLTQLDYKAKLYNKKFKLVSPYRTTQTCSNCQFRMGSMGTEKLKLSDRYWTCPDCKVHHVRDHNAAKNILKKGRSL